MNDAKFSKARMSLTLWYELFIFLIVLAFSIVLFATETNNFGRVVLQRNFGNRPPRILSTDEFEDLRDQVIELRRSFALDLIVIDTAILLIGASLSYILAGKTLDPIKRTFEDQKNFLANASHEFRTPLAAIQTATEVALRSKSKTKEDYQKVLQQTLQESIRLSVIADELLLLSRIDAGITTLRLKDTNISKILNEVIDEVRPLLLEKKLELVGKIHPNVILPTDPHRFKQVLLIFLDNAIKFTKEKGTITIALDKKPKVQLKVEDTGIGISQKDIPHIFERFYQADKARGGNSAGLGLAIAKWIVTAHNGNISVKSKENIGTTFILTFH